LATGVPRAASVRKTPFQSLVGDIVKDRWLYVLLLPAFVMLFIFNYIPIYGLVIAFKDYNGTQSIMASPWVGLKYFEMMTRDPFIWQVIRNTLILGAYSIVFTFPAPILLALMLNELKSGKYKKISQTISYLPYFISTVIVVSMMKEFLSLDGIINLSLKSLGMKAVNFMSDPKWFRTLYTSSEIWQGVGWGSVLYLAATSGISDELYEAATIDGANRLQKIWYVTLPCLMPTISIQFILAMGGLLGASFEKIILMYSPATYSTADVIATYVYRKGIQGSSYSYGVAVGAVNSVVSFLFVYASNLVMRKVNGYSFW
jgi:putative aldouronate transport system permease protein